MERTLSFKQMQLITTNENSNLKLLARIISLKCHPNLIKEENRLLLYREVLINQLIKLTKAFIKSHS